MTDEASGVQSPEDPYGSSDHDVAMDTESEDEEHPSPTERSDRESAPDLMETGDSKDVISNKIQATSVSLDITKSEDGLAKRTDLLTSGIETPDDGQSPRAPANGTVQGTMEPITLGTIKNLSDRVHGLTVPIWQRIAVYTDPIQLGKLLQVSPFFHAMLSPERILEVDFQKRFSSDPRFIPSEIVWHRSRVMSSYQLPKPLKGRTDIEMWRLMRGNQCQVCLQRKPFLNSHDNPDPWYAGPGQNGIRVIWLCGIRICGTCLSQKCQQEVSLQLSTTFPSFLIQALPSIFLTQSDDWVPESLLLRQGPPPHIQIRKLYYQPHIDRVLEQFKVVKDLGDGAAGEWIKGLDEQCREQVADAGRWEQWEAQGGISKVNARNALPPVPPAVPPSTFTNTQIPFHPPPVPGARSHPQQEYIGAPFSHQLQGPPPGHPLQFPNHYPVPGYGPSPGFPGQYGPPQGPPGYSGAPGYYGPPPPPYVQMAAPPPQVYPQVPQGRPRRSLQEVNEARAARRHEIERRCQELNPPITPKVLGHMQSFQAALQISFPFTDTDWNVLLPRLLAQREAAEAQEAVLLEQLRVIQSAAVRPSIEDLSKKDPNELNENDWETTQIPVHQATAKLADEYLAEKWHRGASVTQDTAPYFAANVLLTVRERYERKRKQEAAENGSLRSQIPLSLESMKWLYDNKVKGHAEVYQKDLFQCSGCDAHSRYYGFEGVIQHYAAKHTTALSLGNIIVNWRTEWPDESPFNPHPGHAANGWQQGGSQYASATGHNQYGDYVTNQESYSQQQSIGAISSDPMNNGVESYSNYADQTGYQANNNRSANSQIYVQPAPSADSQRQQLIEMAQYSRDLWNHTMGIKEMPASVRIHVLIQQMSIKFEKRFHEPPDIAMFLHGLNDNAQMRPIRSINGLSCNLCNKTDTSRSMDRKQFTLPSLVNHFKNMHLTPGQSATDIPGLDWRADMVDLPEKTVIESLIDSNGMDDKKFHLIAAIFPDIFPEPLPSLNSLKESRAKAAAARIRLEKLRALDVVTSAPSQVSQTASNNNSRPESRRVSQEPSKPRSRSNSDNEMAEPPGEDEYDPSRPSFYGSIMEPSAPRSAGLQKPPQYVLPPGIVSLGVEPHGPESPSTQGGYADRLLRHSRGTKRPDSATVRRDSLPMQETFGKPPSSIVPDAAAADRFLENINPGLSLQHNRDAYAKNAYSPLEYNARPQDYAVQAPQQIYDSPSRYAYGTSAVPPVPTRYDGRAYEEDAYYRAAVVQEQRWDGRAVQAPYGTQAYPSRDRSRSPRRSLPREYTGYEAGAAPQHDDRGDPRWRGESPPRAGYYRGAVEAAYSTGRPGETFISRDAQGRNVRYVAVPVDDYEAHGARYPSRPQPPEVRPGEMLQLGSDGRYYVVARPDQVRYTGDYVDSGMTGQR